MSTTTSLSTFDQIMAEWRAMCDENRRLKGENDRLWRYLTDEVGIVTLPEWMPTGSLSGSLSGYERRSGVSDMDELQRRIGEWGTVTFPEATDATIIDHLEDEIAELVGALQQGDVNGIAEELADAQHLLFHLAHRAGISLHLATVTKFGANQARTWGPSERGYWKRVAQPQPTEEGE